MNSIRHSIISTPAAAGTLADEVLWSYFKAGNELAFSILYKRYVNRLFNYGMHSCKDKELVKDCLQELFARLWSKREALAAVGSVNHYLFKSFRRMLVGRLITDRKHSSRLQDIRTNFFEFILPTEDLIIEDEARTQQLEMLKASINALTRRQREAIFLKFFNELSYEEVSSVMELRMDSVYNLISKSLDALRTKMKDNSCAPAHF